jgi:hypothetical protein
MQRDELFGHGAVVETARRVGDDQPDRIADRYEATQLSQPMPREAQHRDSPGAQQTEQRHGEPAGIGQLQEHAVSWCDPESGEAAGR